MRLCFRMWQFISVSEQCGDSWLCRISRSQSEWFSPLSAVLGGWRWRVSSNILYQYRCETRLRPNTDKGNCQSERFFLLPFPCTFKGRNLNCQRRHLWSTRVLQLLSEVTDFFVVTTLGGFDFLNTTTKRLWLLQRLQWKALTHGHWNQFDIFWGPMSLELIDCPKSELFISAPDLQSVCWLQLEQLTRVHLFFWSSVLNSLIRFFSLCPLFFFRSSRTWKVTILLTISSKYYILTQTTASRLFTFRF